VFQLITLGSRKGARDEIALQTDRYLTFLVTKLQLKARGLNGLLQFKN
jgi:hypothetical protein